MSVAIGASATGARAYTATASQGLLYMVEALYNAAGLGLPIVMTVANRAIGAPINIWNDHSDSMSQRDSGLDPALRGDQPGGGRPPRAGVQARGGALAAGDGLHGRLHPHARLRAARGAGAGAGRRLPARRSSRARCSTPPTRVTIGAMVGPEAFSEVKYLAHAKQMQALDLIPEIAAEFSSAFGRNSGGLLRSYRSADAETIVVALGSVLGTIEDVVDELRDQGVKIGAVGIKSFRPFPLDEVRAALGHAQRVVVLEKALAVGIGGIVSANVRMALSGIQLHGYTVIAGLGGRSITKASLRGLLADAIEDKLAAADLPRHGLGDRRARAGATRRDRRSGPHAENILRDIGAVAARPH